VWLCNPDTSTANGRSRALVNEKEEQPVTGESPCATTVLALNTGWLAQQT
jgi:hypothetical protein